MASILQTELFSWDQVETSSDLDRLRITLESMPDEPLMRALEAARKGRRDDYPIRPVWNSIIAGIVFEHKSIESLRRELRRNGELRQACGFDLFLGEGAVPLASVYSRFIKKLFRHQKQIDAMFDELVEALCTVLPGFGKRMAIDSKAIDSHGRPSKNEEQDGRRDTDADWGTKRYHGVRKDGTAWEKVKRANASNTDAPPPPKASRAPNATCATKETTPSTDASCACHWTKTVASSRPRHATARPGNTNTNTAQPSNASTAAST